MTESSRHPRRGLNRVEAASRLQEKVDTASVHILDLRDYAEEGCQASGEHGEFRVRSAVVTVVMIGIRVVIRGGCLEQGNSQAVSLPSEGVWGLRLQLRSQYFCGRLGGFES